MWRHGDAQGECDVMAEAEIGIMLLQAKECQRMLANHEKLGRGKERFHAESQREHGPADTLILDFQAPGLWDNTSLVLSAT